ncbi:MAG: hypothetical protein ACJ74O_05160 [Frankiaceae bacterium]
MQRPPLRRLLPSLAGALALLSLAAAVACALGARSAAHRAAVVEGWPYAVGAVAAHPLDDARGPGIVWYDLHSHRRVLWLAANDVDDLPPGSIAGVAYQADGPEAELRALPHQRTTAYLSLMAVTALCALACGGWWWLARTRTAGQPSPPLPRRRR